MTCPTSKSPALVLLWLFLLFLFMPVSQANFLSTLIDTSGGPNNEFTNTQGGAGVAGPIDDSYSNTLSNSLGDAELNVNITELDYGVFKGNGEGIITFNGNQLSNFNISGLARGFSSDDFAVNATGLMGQPGTLTALAVVTGSGSASQPTGPGLGSVVLSLYSQQVDIVTTVDSVSERVSGNWGASQDPSDPIFTGDALGVPFVIVADFIFGDAINIEITSEFQANVDVAATDPAAEYLAGVDLSNSFTWLGFSSVVDEFGSPVTNFTVVSDSGFDWSLAVPVPAAAWLFPAGLMAGIGWMRRRRIG